jgi:D-xylose 1-dehydrogenase (NADP+, D-xylono-1,5-lactone-forming)
VLPAIAASHNGRLVALGSRDAERARQMVEPYPAMRVLDSYDAVLEDAEVDAVYIPLVNSLHREWTLRAMQAGKHVLCEKPLAMDAREAEEMAAASDASGMRLMEAFMYRFHPAMRAFVDGVSDAMHVQASFGFKLKDEANYRMQAELGGGALLDVGCYVVSAARWILGEPAEVLARARMRSGVDMSVSALLQFADGKTASLWASFESPEEQELTVITQERVHRREQPFTSRHDPHDPYQLMVESFADSVLRDRPVAIPPSESIANMRVLDRIREAAATR